MDSEHIGALCLKRIYEAELTEAERSLVDDYAKTANGSDYMKECREMKDQLTEIADVAIKPIDEKAMIQKFERTVRQTFDETVRGSWKEAYGLPLILGVLGGVMFAFDGWNFIDGLLLGICVLWVAVTWLQRRYFAKTLSRPDLYEYAKASRQRSDQILSSLPGKLLVGTVGVLVVAAIGYATYWGYQQYGLIVPGVVIFVLVEAAVIYALQHRKLKQSNAEVWDWWAEHIKE